MEGPDAPFGRIRPLQYGLAMARTLLVFNRNSRRSTPRLLDRLLQELSEEGASVETLLLPDTAASEVLARRAAERESRILVAGGDGTVHWAIQHLAGARAPLGIVPTGTGNILARELKLPLDPVQALRALRSAREVRLDLGIIGGHYFAAMAGIGLDADLVRRVGAEGKRRWGRAAFVVAGYRSICGFCPFTAILAQDGSGSLEGRFWAVLVSNTSVYSGVVDVAPEADPTDGYLEVTAIPDRLSRANLLAQAASLWVFRRRLRGVFKARVRCLEVALQEPVPLQVDGELMGPAAGTVTIGLTPGALTALAPA